MPLFLVLFACTLAVILAGGCGQTDTYTPEVVPESGLFEGLSWGTDSTLDIVTWNLKLFPLNGSSTIEYVITAIDSLKPDLVGLQEINSAAAFQEVLAGLPGYSGYHGGGSWSLAWVWNDATVNVEAIYEIFPDLWGPFPRPPLVMHVEFDGSEVVVVNNHFKCCGDNIIEYGQSNDEEFRRLWASDSLYAWASQDMPDERVIILGDLNDDIADAPDQNVFNAFLDSPDLWRFTDMAIALDQGLSWSYRNASHLDHILISDELFSSFEKAASDVQTLRIDRYLSGGYAEYQTHVSDHYPVGLRLDLR